MVYLLHFERPWKHAQHYLGATDQPIDNRLMKHYLGQGARLLQVITEQNISWKLVRIWKGSFKKEKALKTQHNNRKLCPVCLGKVSYEEAELKVMEQLTYGQLKAERDEMEKQMIDFRNQLEATQFWKNVTDPGGLTSELVAKELKDYYWLIQSVGKVYHVISEGLITKQATKPDEVIKIVDELTSVKIQEAEEKLQLVIDSWQEKYDKREKEWEKCLEDLHVELKNKHDEITRLKEGNFTSEEFQYLCHNIGEDNQKEFALGCMNYMKKLFGYCPLTWKVNYEQNQQSEK